jgi:serine protease inhibitor
MMHQENYFAYAETENLQIISLPYSRHISLFVLLPIKIDGLREIENGFTTNGNLLTILNNMRHNNRRQIILSLPMFLSKMT